VPQDPNTKRLPIYLTPEELQLIRVAAAYAGKSMAAFAKEHLVTAARQTIAAHTRPDPS
jgi:uncharacterized protein (DUF1778 family)